MDEYHCKKCTKLLFKGRLLDAGDVVEIPCRGCGLMNTYRATPFTDDQYEPDGAGGYVLTKASAEA